MHQASIVVRKGDGMGNSWVMRSWRGTPPGDVAPAARLASVCRGDSDTAARAPATGAGDPLTLRVTASPFDARRAERPRASVPTSEGAGCSGEGSLARGCEG